MKPRLVRSALLAALMPLPACSDAPTSQHQGPTPTLTITVPAATVYEGDGITLSAVYRDELGNVVANAPIRWTVDDPSRAELGDSGFVFALKAGTVRVTATSSGLSATSSIVIVRPAIRSVAVLLPNPSISRWDVLTIGVQSIGPGGRILLGRMVALSSDNPNVAVVDASGRVRGLAPGTTTIRAVVEGVAGTAQLQVLDAPVVHNLTMLDGNRLPVLVASDSAWWNGVREFHEVYMEAGSLELSGAAQPRYVIIVRYAEYNVVTVNGARRLELRANLGDYDRGLVAYDARGDMQLTSEWIYPLSHVGSATTGGIEVNFRIAGTDDYQRLFFRREPK